MTKVYLFKNQYFSHWEDFFDFISVSLQFILSNINKFFNWKFPFVKRLDLHPIGAIKIGS